MVSNKAMYGELDFYPRPPRGGRRMSTYPCSRAMSNFYPRPPRGGRPDGRVGRLHLLLISIHALREEGDAMRV